MTQISASIQITPESKLTIPALVVLDLYRYSVRHTGG